MDLNAFFRNLGQQKWLLVFVSFALYFNTLFNEYCLDDAIVITQNQHVKKGLRGISDILSNDTFQGFFGVQKDLVAGGRYRPLSVVTFAIEYQFFGKNPLVQHFVNVLLFVFTVLFLWKLMQRLFPDRPRLAWITALIFALHPVHTEAVANIKGRDEILTLLFSLLAWLSALKWSESRKSWRLLLSGFWLFLGLMSKEHAAAFVVIIPLSLWFFKEVKLSKLILPTLPLFVAFLAFVAIRHTVLGAFSFDEGKELMNNPFAQATLEQRYATIIFTMLWYIKLLFWPHPLTFDYYPYHVPLIDFSSFYAVFGLLIIISFLVLAISGFTKRRWFSFWIIFYAATLFLMSNLLFTVGTFMNERFLFIPSIAFCFGLALGFEWLFHKKQRVAVFLFSLLAVLATIKTVSRNTIWYDDWTLFSNDVKISSNSAKSNTVMGGQLFEKSQKAFDTVKQKEMLTEARVYIDKALSIHPTYNDARLLKGNIEFQLSSPKEALQWYFKILENAPKHSFAWQNSLIAVQNISSVDEKIAHYEKLLLYDSTRFEVLHNLGLYYARDKADFVRGIPLLEKAVKRNPRNKDALRDLGIAYGMQHDYQRSEELLQRAINLYPTDGQLYFNLGITLLNQGKKQEAQSAFDKASEFDKSIKPVKIHP